MANDTVLTKREADVKTEEIPPIHGDGHKFFPFLEDSERQHVDVHRKNAAFPKLGLCALAIAVFLIILSAAVLIVIAGPGKVTADWTVHVWHTHRYVSIPKPAAWLSGILSFISVAFNIALSEGLNVAWWYQAQRDDATVRELHELWEHGTSGWSVFKSGVNDVKNGLQFVQRRVVTSPSDANHPLPARKTKRVHFSYVALATLFVATIPLNGFLLQNAVVVVSTTVHRNGNVSVPMIQAEDFTSIDIYAQDVSGPIFGWSPQLGLISQEITAKLPALVDLKTFQTLCPGTCNLTVPGVGFQIQCTTSSQPYNITVDPDNNFFGSEEMQVNGSDVFSVQVGFNEQYINQMTLRTLWKDDYRCVGNYHVETCTLNLATVAYPIVLNSGVQEATMTGLTNSTVMSLNMDLLTEQPRVISVLSDDVNYSRLAKRQGYTNAGSGVASFFAESFNSTINLRWNEDNLIDFTQLQADSLFGQQQLATNSNWTTSSSQNDILCEATFGNVNQQLLALVQSMMFQMAGYATLVEQTDPNYNGAYDLQNTTALMTFAQNEYRVVWAWYAGSLAVTLLVAAAITPTFWGFWRLERQTSMSPFETARAFHAPVLFQEDATLESDELLHRVGNKHIHRDLVPVGRPPDRWASVEAREKAQAEADAQAEPSSSAGPSSLGLG